MNRLIVLVFVFLSATFVAESGIPRDDGLISPNKLREMSCRVPGKICDDDTDCCNKDCALEVEPFRCREEKSCSIGGVICAQNSDCCSDKCDPSLGNPPRCALCSKRQNEPCTRDEMCCGLWKCKSKWPGSHEKVCGGWMNP